MFSSDLFNFFGPVVCGFGLIIWMGWRVFWKVDQRTRMELSAKDKQLAAASRALDDKEAEVVLERTKRFAAEEELSRRIAQSNSFEERIKDLAERIGRQAEEIKTQAEEIKNLRQEVHELRAAS